MGKNKLDIHIEAEFGSDWQEEVQWNSLRLMLQAWSSHMRQAHKKNKVFIDGTEI